MTSVLDFAKDTYNDIKDGVTGFVEEAGYAFRSKANILRLSTALAAPVLPSIGRTAAVLFTSGTAITLLDSCGGKDAPEPQKSVIQKPDIDELVTVIEKATGKIAENKQFVTDGPMRGSIRRLDLAGSGVTEMGGIVYPTDVAVIRGNNDPVIKKGNGHIDVTNIDPASVESTQNGNHVVGKALPGTTIDLTVDLNDESKVTDLFTETTNEVNTRIFRLVNAKKLIWKIKSFDFEATGAETAPRLIKTLQDGNQDLVNMSVAQFSAVKVDNQFLRSGKPQ